MALSNAVIRGLEKIVRTVDLSRVSVSFQIEPEGRSGFNWGPTDKKLAVFKGVPVHGLSMILLHEDGFTINVPWKQILKGADVGHCVYVIICHSEGQPEAFDVKTGKRFAYIGKTSRGIANRFKQHLSAIISPYGGSTFHKVARGSENRPALWPRSIQLVDHYRNEEAAYDAEEALIAEHQNLETVQLLNSVSSRAQLKRLLDEFPHLNGQISAEDAELKRIQLQNRLADQWSDPDFAMRVICNNPNNLDYAQIESIRLLKAMGHNVSQIAKLLKLDWERTERVFSGRTYKRVIT